MIEGMTSASERAGVLSNFDTFRPRTNYTHQIAKFDSFCDRFGTYSHHHISVPFQVKLHTCYGHFKPSWVS